MRINVANEKKYFSEIRIGIFSLKNANGLKMQLEKTLYKFLIHFSFPLICVNQL